MRTNRKETRGLKHRDMEEVGGVQAEATGGWATTGHLGGHVKGLARIAETI